MSTHRKHRQASAIIPLFAVASGAASLRRRLRDIGRRDIVGGALGAWFLAVAAAAMTPAAAHEDERLLYAFTFAGFRIGDVLISLDESDTDYHSELRGLARGISLIFGDFRANLSGEGQIGDGTPVPLQPEEFHRNWSVGHTVSTSTVAFDPTTHVATAHERLFNPTNGKDLPPTRRYGAPLPIAVEKRTDVLDPMTAVIAARDLIRRNWSDNDMAGTDYRLPVYDGRHRYDVVITPGAVEDEKIGGVIRQVVPVTAQVEPVGGFEKDMAKHTRGSKGRVVFSADERFIPLQIVIHNTFGTGTFTLVTDCRDNPAPCDTLAEKSRISGVQ